MVRGVDKEEYRISGVQILLLGNPPLLSLLLAASKHEA